MIPENSGPDFVVVSDGQTSDAALKLSGKDKAWLLDFLKKEKTPINEVFIMTLDPAGNYNLIKKEQTK